MSNAKKPKYLTPQKAAAAAGMSRAAFLEHVEAGRVVPDLEIGSRRFFLPLTIQRWLAVREKNGVRKRGPKPKQRAA